MIYLTTNIGAQIIALLTTVIASSLAHHPPHFGVCFTVQRTNESKQNQIATTQSQNESSFEILVYKQRNALSLKHSRGSKIRGGLYVCSHEEQ